MYRGKANHELFGIQTAIGAICLFRNKRVSPWHPRLPIRCRSPSFFLPAFLFAPALSICVHLAVSVPLTAPEWHATYFAYLFYKIDRAVEIEGTRTARLPPTLGYGRTMERNYTRVKRYSGQVSSGPLRLSFVSLVPKVSL